MNGPSGPDRPDRTRRSAASGEPDRQSEAAAAQASLSGIAVLLEDNHLLGVVKPVNIPVQEDASGDPDMLTLLKSDLKIRHDKPGNVFLGLVHRLDRPVGGAMIFAKTSKAASRLSDSVRTHAIRKTYAAVTNGVPREREGRLVHYLLKNERTNIVASVRKGTPGAKEAILDYRVLEDDGRRALVLVELHTGRSHQIRVQMSTIGCPLFGDQKYGASQTRPGEQIALWSVRLRFPHPVSKESTLLVSLPPDTAPWTQWSGHVYKMLREELEHGE
ncbi:RNA pseudouridine synthase [Saccharibacillus sp. CPCC 101409]|uniref:RluA family pseudouridine synthase n=1 Tax=Saccharibacillus sp. CPCC 101409 TaxID=3058041 RepID=UPI0026712EC3|nr:RNA pseudouridine synthase [Saccharibacillus sp. CPCC 101409]MDO3413058.1 RNA pseudouridine synthase [Saccharibacillus sp. CPCC 101409]